MADPTKINIVFHGKRRSYTIEYVMKEAQIKRAYAISRIRKAIEDPSRENRILVLNNRKEKSASERLTPEQRETLKGFRDIHLKSKTMHDKYYE